MKTDVGWHGPPHFPKPVVIYKQTGLPIIL
jgi:hypothetical protein